MPKKLTFRERRLQDAKKKYKRKYKTRPNLWMHKVKGDGDLEDYDSEQVAGPSNSIREEGDESLLGDISEMSDAEREIVSSYLRIQRKDRPKQVFCSI